MSDHKFIGPDGEYTFPKITRVEDGEYTFPKITRVEMHGQGVADHFIIDRRRTEDIEVSISLQDNGRTLKVFVKRRGE